MMKRSNKKSEVKKVYTLVAVSAMVIAVVIGVFVYNLKNRQGLFFRSENQNQPEDQNQMGSNENNGENDLPSEGPVEFQGRTLVADAEFPIGVIDGIVEDDPDIAGQTFVLRADVFKIYPEAPFDSKIIKISFEDAEVFFADNERNAMLDDIENIKAGTAISIGLIDGETNRDIFFKDEFKAAKITFFAK